MGEKLLAAGVSIIQPTGGHAVYIDAKHFYSHIPLHEFPAQALVCSLYKKGGIRSVEIGSVMFQNPAMELVRLAFPRRAYTQSHFDYAIEVIIECFKERDTACGLKIIWEPPFLRHFSAQFEPVSKVHQSQ